MPVSTGPCDGSVYLCRIVDSCAQQLSEQLHELMYSLTTVESDGESAHQKQTAINLHRLALRTSGICQALESAHFQLSFAVDALRSFRNFADELKQLPISGSEADKLKFQKANVACCKLLRDLKAGVSTFRSSPPPEPASSADYLASPDEWWVTVREIMFALDLTEAAVRKRILLRIAEHSRKRGTGRKPEQVRWVAVRQLIISDPDSFNNTFRYPEELDDQMRTVLRKD